MLIKGLWVFLVHFVPLIYMFISITIVLDSVPEIFCQIKNLLKVFTYLFERQSLWESQFSLCWLTAQMTQQARKPRARNIFLNFLCGYRGPSTWTIFCCWFRHISRSWIHSGATGVPTMVLVWDTGTAGSSFMYYIAIPACNNTIFNRSFETVSSMYWFGASVLAHWVKLLLLIPRLYWNAGF